MKEELWIKEGYIVFSELGEKGLNIEKLAGIVGKSKSSFYHYFVDLNLFIDALLQHHLNKVGIIAEKEKNATCINPDLIDILIEHKIDLFFNRQLRINSDNLKYREIVSESNRIIGNHFVNLLQTEKHFTINESQAQAVYDLALNNFYLSINQSTFDAEWLSKYFDNLFATIKQF